MFTVDFQDATTSGSLIVELIASPPPFGSTGLPQTDVTLRVDDEYTDGYWSVTAANALVSTDYDIDLAGNGFTSYTMDANTRVLKSTASSWVFDGDHVAGVAPIASRDALSGISSVIFGLGNVCVTPTPSAITGNDQVCENVTGETYFVDNVGGTTYTWTITGGTSDPNPASGQGNSSITVDWGSGGLGDVSVVASTTAGTCTDAPAVNLAVTISPVALPITGDNTVCEGATGEVYSVTNTTGYTYDWTISGGTQASGGTTNSITVDWGSGDGNVSVVATTSCGEAAAVNLAVSVSPTVATSAVSGSSSVSENTTKAYWVEEWLSGYDFNKLITIDNTKVAGTANHTNFPVLISFTDADLKTTGNGGDVTNANGYDIAFTSSDGITQLDHQIEKYDATTGEYVAWVRIPKLDYNDDTDIYMYYGNSAVTTDQSSTGTWDVNYTAVWHMSEDPSGSSPQITDATFESNDGTSAGTMTAGDLIAGKCGLALDFDGIDDYLDLGEEKWDGSPSGRTYSFWFQRQGNGTVGVAGVEFILGKGAGNSFGFGFGVNQSDKNFVARLNSANSLSGLTVVDNTWYHVAVVGNASDFDIYIDGSLDASPSYVYGGDNDLILAMGRGNQNYFNGLIDEVRISSIARSADWIATQFNNQDDPSTFYSVGTETAYNASGFTYAWTITGGTQASGGTTNSITVDWGAAGAGDVSVIATGPACGAQAAVNLPVTISVAYPTGPGGVGTTNGASDLSLWLDASKITGLADGADMVTWTDQSGNGYHASVDPNASPPIYSATGGGNGQPAVTFADVDGMLVSNNIEVMPTEELSVFVAGNMEDDGTAWDVFIATSSNDNDDDGWAIQQDNNADQMSFYLDDIAANTCTLTPLFGSDQVWTLIFNTTDDTGYAYKSESGCTMAFSGPITYDGTGPSFDLNIGFAYDNTVPAYFLTGDIEEVIEFDVAVNDAQRIIISNYLSAKYAITLSSNDVYNEDDVGNGDHDFDVAGIGQAADGSNHTDAQGTGWVRMNTPSGLANSEFLMWGHDDVTLTLNTGDVGGTTNNRINRKWRVSENGGDGVGTVTLTFDVTNFIIETPGDLQLLIDADGTFAAGATTHTTGLSYDSETGIVTFTGVDFSDNDYFTLGSASADNILGGLHYAIADGVFTGTANWSLNDPEGSSCTCAPTGGSDHPMIGNHAVTIAADISIDNLKIKDGGSLTYTAASVDLTINDGGTITLSDGSLLDGNGQTDAHIQFNGPTDRTVFLYGSGDRITDLNITVNSAGTTTFTGTGDITGSATSVFKLNTDNNTVVNDLTGTITMADLAFEVNDLMTFTNNGVISLTGDLAFNTTNSTLTNNSTITVTDDILSDTNTDDGNSLTNNSVMSIGDDFDMTDADITVNNAGSFTHSGDFLNVGGAVVISNLNGGTWTSSAASHAGVTFNSNDATNTFIYDLAGAQDVFVPSDGQYYNVTFQGSGVKTPLASIVVLNDLTIRETATLSANSFDITISGDWTNNSTFNTGTQTVIFDGGDQFISHLIAPGAFYNLTVQGTGNKTSNGNLDVNNDLEIGGSATLEMSTNTVNLFLGGDWNNTGGAFNEGSQTVTFDGAAGQAINTTVASETFYDIDVSNSGQTITMNKDVNISNTLEFTSSGYIDINANDLTITNWDDGDVVGLGTNLDRFVIVDETGFFKATGVGAGETVNFPIGVSSGAANYARADILNNDAANTDFEINLCNYMSREGGCSGGTQITADVIDYTWTINSASDNATVTLYWDESLELTGFTRATMAIGHYGPWWQLIGTNGASTNLTGTVHYFSATTTSFSPFGAGNPDSPLPIELISFDANPSDNGDVQLDWQTATEINNDYFTIERSKDAIGWENVKEIEGARNSTQLISYTAVDKNPYTGISYYRLKQTDFDGQYSHSDVRLVNIDDLKNSLLKVYPSPANGRITIQGSKAEIAKFRIYDLQGQDVSSLIKILKSSDFSLTLDISTLRKGMYVIETSTAVVKIFKQ